MSDEGSSRELSNTTHGSDVLTEGLKHRERFDTRQRALAFKVSHILVSLLFLWLLTIHVIGLVFFTKGFLLSRLVLEDRSSCNILPDGSSSTHVANGCWHPKKFEKAVVVVVDALRYDFCVPQESSDRSVAPKFYQNNLPFLYDTASKHPEKAFLLPFIADPPTSTLQRLKALTAGNLPTFIDIGSNFAGQAIEEDNILVQLKDQGKTIVHLGDDTWHSLFPGYFDKNLTHSYDSFNVWDLHTVDNGVIEHIFPLLRNQLSARWDIIFAHFLGVDHAGHRYGPDHRAMAEKLRQMNTVLEQISQELDDETVLIVLGDHGMDSKGDHGGESDDEVEATLWVYSKGARFGRLEKTHVQPPLTAKDRPVEQIDLVSTLSLLLGLPVPFNNLGTPIPEAFLNHIPAQKSDQDNLGKVNSLVFEQMQRYQQKYSESRDFAESTSTTTLARELKASSAQASEHNNLLFSDWHTQTVGMYRQLWANFDLQDMALGVGLLLLGLIALILVGQTTISDCENEVPPTLRNIAIGSFVGISLSVVGLLISPSGTWLMSAIGPIFLSATGGVIGAIATRFMGSGMLALFIRPSSWTWLGLVFIVTQAAGFASNSYTIHEDTILTFFLGTFGAITLLSSLRQASNSDRILGAYHSILFIALNRAASISRLCREEQMPGCRSTFYASQTSSTSAPWQLLLPFAITTIMPEIVKAFYQGTASYVGSAGFAIGFCFRIALLLSAVYWTFDAADNGKWLTEYASESTVKSISIGVARCVLAIAIPIGVSLFVWAKPCIDINILKSPTTGASNTKPQITIFGYANTFGTRYFLLIPPFVLSIILLLPPMGQYALAICTWQILCLLEILDTSGLTINGATQSYIGPIVLAMLGSYHFFKTGHQAALSSIQWNAAFVPLRTIRYPWSPILILLNNFGPQILCAAAVPLTVLWKRPISKEGLKGYWSDIMQAGIAHVLYYATIQVATTMWAGHLRRHLMLYRVFMPRFLMASGVLLTIDVMLILVALSGARVTGSSVAEIFGH